MPETAGAPPDRARLLALYPALAALAPAELDGLLRPEATLRIPTGLRVFAESEPCRGFPLVVEGSIKVVKTAPSGREMLLYRVGPGDSCIISSSCLLGHTPYTARGESETPVTLAVLPEALFARLLADDRAFRDFVFHLLAERIADLMQLVEEIAFHRLDRRLARLLLARGDAVHATHQALADELGSVREIVSRLLKGFAAEGLVELGRERIVLRDRAGLRRLAGDDD
ncbi:MAG: Crp/Fnr family transcriptional regulator [Rhodocyclaceae bacterium]|nr:Crp/Fnr family transcriptional regulator [Rhodocyclaceae bacterium]